jgi:hypothetical protein
MLQRRDPVGQRLALVENASRYIAAQSRITVFNKTRLQILESLRQTYCPLGGTVHETVRRRKGERSARLIYRVYLEQPPQQSFLALWPIWPRPLCTITMNSAIEDDEEFEQLLSVLKQNPVDDTFYAAK